EGLQSASQVAFSPPIFSGTPPSRTDNSLIQDAQFGVEKLSPLSASSSVLSPSGMSSPSSSSCRGGCVRMKFGPKPAAIRVEGFECLNRDRQHSTVLAMAW
ncbi:hypothetical protein U1Q18_015536, partial [Sarracenia purpurea var. burkii]